MKRFICLLILLCGLAGCNTAGRDFARPSADSFVLGETTRSEILTRFGRPIRQSTRVITNADDALKNLSPMSPAAEPGNFAFLLYSYIDASATYWIGSPTMEKVIGFDFWNDRLIAYSFVSSFQADRSNFDETKVKQGDGGRITRDEIVRLLGEPTGRAIYPAVKTQGEEKFIYHYSEADHQKRQRIIKRLEVLFDAEGRLREYAYVSEDRPLPTPTQAGSTFVPIFIPRGK